MKATPYSRNKKSLNSDMNVVPYIDVMLVLLVIFMVTAPMLTTGVEIDLPKEIADNLPATTEMPVIVLLTATGEIFVNFESEDVPTTELELINQLSELQATKQAEAKGELQVMIQADQSIPYGEVIALMSGLKQSGIQKVGLVTESPKAK